MFPYLPNTSKDVSNMLQTIGVEKIEDLFDDIPSEIKLQRDLYLNNPMAEMEVVKKISSILEKNIPITEFVSFLGAGAYDHYIPSIVKHICSRSEFYTAYTPYQPEISQGTLQSIFEYQSMICELTGMDVSNASMYDGSSGTAEACMMASVASKRKKILVSKTTHPEIRNVIKTYMHFYNVEVEEIPYSEGITNTDTLKTMLNKDVAGVIIQSPNFFGIIEDVESIGEIAHNNKSLLIVNTDPISLGILKSPGELGADIVTGEGQSLGTPLNFGGPYLGFFFHQQKVNA